MFSRLKYPQNKVLYIHVHTTCIHALFCLWRWNRLLSVRRCSWRRRGWARWGWGCTLLWWCRGRTTRRSTGGGNGLGRLVLLCGLHPLQVRDGRQLREEGGRGRGGRGGGGGDRSIYNYWTDTVTLGISWKKPISTLSTIHSLKMRRLHKKEISDWQNTYETLVPHIVPTTSHDCNHTGVILTCVLCQCHLHKSQG